MKTSWVLIGFLLLSRIATAQLFKPSPANYEVSRAVEIEAIPFVYLSGGYHVSVGYRYNRFRFRASIIDAGRFDSQPGSSGFKRYESGGSFGFFAGYYIWRNLETYGFIDRQVFTVKQKAGDEFQSLNAISPGIGLGYQFFIGRHFYIQPAVHVYLRGSQSVAFSDGSQYTLSTSELSPILRVGIRPWKRWK